MTKRQQKKIDKVRELVESLTDKGKVNLIMALLLKDWNYITQPIDKMIEEFIE